MIILKADQLDPIAWVMETFWPVSGIVAGVMIACVFIFGSGTTGGGDNGGGDGGGGC